MRHFWFFSNIVFLSTYRVAFASSGSQRSLLNVHLAIRRRLFQKDQICVSVRLESLKPGLQHTTTSPFTLPYFLGSIEFFLQDFSNLQR